ncbi:MAG: SGNH/GDSL hydrolase family protein, partial [Actinomycetota bacterium]|nr:SGNH/GDSL hydrolase family protein [Actinomycetota bacterium]
VVITIGANDFSYRHDDVTSGACHADCLADTIQHVASVVTEIVATVHQLRAGEPTAVLLTGYWNVFEDGAVARRLFPLAGLAASAELTEKVNNALHQVAVNNGAAYVDLYDVFDGPDAPGDVTTLLADDGDHPNAEGHGLIARRLMAAGLPGLEF